MTRIVTTRYRYKRPPRKRKPVVIEVPEVVTAKNSRRLIGEKGGGRDAACPVFGRMGAVQPSTSREAERVVHPDATTDRKPAIVTIRRTPAKLLPPDLLPETPEEYQRRGDAADALWHELVHRVAEKA
jgi:hypothetical protein